MSAFMLSPESWQRVVDAITEPPAWGENVADELGVSWHSLLTSWYTANDLAVSSRYSAPRELMAPEVLPAQRIRDEIEWRKASNGPRTINPEPFARCVQYVKTLRCLRYQCAEEVPDWLKESHSKAMDNLDRAIAIMAMRAVDSCKEFEAARWG